MRIKSEGPSLWASLAGVDYELVTQLVAIHIEARSDNGGIEIVVHHRLPSNLYQKKVGRINLCNALNGHAEIRETVSIQIALHNAIFLPPPRHEVH